MSKSNIGSIEDLILVEISHDVLELPRKREGPSSTAGGESVKILHFSFAVI